MVAPEWAVAAMVLAWGLLAGQFIAITRANRNPWWYLAVPAAAAALWILLVPGLGTLLGWSP